MANTTINGLPVAVTIDGAQDLLPIYTASLVATQAISRNTFLGITGSPVGNSDIQTLSNKTLGNTNTVTLKDTLFTLQDDGDTTKQAKFQLSGITTATTRTYTLPNASSTLADIATAQTLTNKTLTSPTITSPTITNATISADAITGFSSANNGSIYGISITGSAIQSSTAFADGIILPKALLTGTGSTWVWQTWTPTWTNLTVGNGTLVAKYSQIGKTVRGYISFIVGSTSAVSGSIIWSLPVTASSNYAGTDPIGQSYMEDVGNAFLEGMVILSSTTTARLAALGSASTYVGLANTSGSVPFTWGTSDFFRLTFTYEAA